MSVVFGLADRISVLVYGQIIASRHAGRDPRQSEGPGSLSRRGGGLMLEVSDLHAYYGKSHILQGVDIAIDAGEVGQPARPQRRRPLHHRQGDHGRSAAAGHDQVQGQRYRGPAELPDRASRAGLRSRAPRYLSRPDGAAEPDARHQGPAQAGQVAAGGHAGDVPQPRRARRHRGRRAVGRREADADDVPHADGRPRAGHDRRADRGPGAA